MSVVVSSYRALSTVNFLKYKKSPILGDFYLMYIIYFNKKYKTQYVSLCYNIMCLQIYYEEWGWANNAVIFKITTHLISDTGFHCFFFR